MWHQLPMHCIMCKEDDMVSHTFFSLLNFENDEFSYPCHKAMNDNHGNLRWIRNNSSDVYWMRLKLSCFHRCDH